MTLPDENPGGFSPVSVNWVAGVSGPLTGHLSPFASRGLPSVGLAPLTAPCSRVAPLSARLSRGPCGPPRTGRRSPVEASGLAPLVTGLASGSSRSSGPTERHGGQGTGSHPTVERHGGQGTGSHSTVECHGGQRTGSRPSVRRHASCLFACARACCPSTVPRGARWRACPSTARTASRQRARDEHRRRGSSTEGSAPASRSAVGWGGTWRSRWTGTTPEASLLPTGGRQE
jgi:hypothetical protein